MSPLPDFPRISFTAILLLKACLLFSTAFAQEIEVEPPYFGIHVVDEATGAGVPLVELRTVNEIRLFTDNAGWIAFHEPGLMNREVFWHVGGPGIEGPKDGFGIVGVRSQTVPGTSMTVKVKNTNIATRLGRLTGQGLYHHSALLGREHPPLNLREPGVTGQDSVQAVPYRGNTFWLWGDTGIERYPLGNFHTTSAFTSGDAHPEKGLLFDYFTEADNPRSLRKMLPSSDPGVVWMFGLVSLADEDGKESLYAGFTRQQGLVPPDERGIAKFDDAEGRFRKIADVEKDDEWHMPAGCAVRVENDDGDHIYFCTPFAYRRVAADAGSLGNPQRYEMFVFDEITRNWTWKDASAPTTSKDEERLLKSGAMGSDQARYHIKDEKTGDAVSIHTASIRWNAWRKKFILIGVQMGNEKSFLGEVWFAESDSVTGPWRKAVKIASHPEYSYYNPVHHPFFDREGGRVIYFEGTYTRQFSGNQRATPRYDYNQLMYRLDLSAPRLKMAH